MIEYKGTEVIDGIRRKVVDKAPKRKKDESERKDEPSKVKENKDGANLHEEDNKAL